MFGIKRFLAAWLLVGCYFEANASAMITFSQIGNDVQATLSGTLDVSNAGPSLGTNNSSGRVRGAPTNVAIGPVIDPSDVVVDAYSASGPTNIGTSPSNIAATSGSGIAGKMYGVNMMAPIRVIVPSGFLTGSVSATSTWANTTIAGLGLTPGTYTFTWTGDYLTVVIPAPVPTLSEWSQMLLAFLLMSAMVYYGRKQRSH